jgi:hypothetical protein
MMCHCRLTVTGKAVLTTTVPHIMSATAHSCPPPLRVHVDKAMYVWIYEQLQICHGTFQFIVDKATHMYAIEHILIFHHYFVHHYLHKQRPSDQ